ncbi:hypothetical protein ACA910_004487 [Epithemia clementina (nom. ined.)]
MTTIQVPENYGYVVLTTVVGQFVVSFAMGGAVMAAREKYNVQYPNLYATPGYHKEADNFNRVQRGHQNMLEMISTYSLLALIGGLRNPIVCSISSVLYLSGSFLYQLGYADTNKDVATARYAKGGIIKYAGLLGAMVSTIQFAGSLNKWW